MQWWIKKRKTLLIFLSVILLSTTNQIVIAEKSDYIGQEFDQFIILEYNNSILNKTIGIDKSINLPISFTYWTNLPVNYLRLIGLIRWQFKNKLIYGTILPQQTIYINITKKPEWAQVLIMNKNISLNAPTINNSGNKGIFSNDLNSDLSTVLNLSESFEKFTSSLIISPLEEAPAQVFSIDLQITCAKLGRLKKSVFNESITFIPEFYPKINIKCNESIKIIAPNKGINYRISIENNGNKKIRIMPDVELDLKWNPKINPPYLDIEANQISYFYLSSISPYEFGWHDEIGKFKINFTAFSFPINEKNKIGGPYTIELEANNYGFSLPCPDLFYIFIISFLVSFLHKKKLSRGD